MSPAGGEPDARRGLLVSAALILAICLVGYALADAVSSHPIGQPGRFRDNVFYYLYGRYERPFLAFLAVAVAVTPLYLLAPGVPVGEPALGSRGRRHYAALVALAVVLAAWLGGRYVLHGLPLSMDEFNAVFQSRIFASGRVAAPVPPEWRDLAPAIVPTFATYLPEDHAWLSGYLPVYAAIRAVFLGIGLDSLVNPVLAGLSVLVIAGIAKRMWPREGMKLGLVVALLATSSQFLLTSMTWYPMPAQLLANSCWLWLYLRGNRAFLWAPWLGVLALGLGNPFPHALFVTPFLVRLVLSGKRLMFAYVVATYAVGSALWLAWWGYALPSESTAAVPRLFGVPDALHLLTQVMSLGLTISWQHALLGLGIGAALTSWRRLSTTERDLAASLLVTLGFYCFFLSSQGHGWGYRYAYPALGSMVLLAAHGLHRVATTVGRRPFHHVAVASTLAALLIQLPLRLRAASEFSRPWADAINLLQAQPALVVVVPSDELWYGTDLVRNDPFLKRPIFIPAPRAPLTIEATPPPAGPAGRSVLEVRKEQLTAIGLVTLRFEATGRSQNGGSR